MVYSEVDDGEASIDSSAHEAPEDEKSVAAALPPKISLETEGAEESDELDESDDESDGIDESDTAESDVLASSTLDMRAGQPRSPVAPRSDTTRTPTTRFGYRLVGPKRRLLGSVEFPALDAVGREVTLCVLDFDEIDTSAIGVDRLTELFEAEAQVLDEIAHPCAPRLIRMGRAGESRYLVLERAEGKSLADVQGPVDPELARMVTRAIAEALEHIHTRGFVACGLRKEHVELVGGPAVARLTRLFLAVEAGETPNALLRSLPLSLPPEYLFGEKYDQKSDQYVLGGMFYELLTGKQPFENNWVRLSSPGIRPKPIAEVRKGIPPKLAEVASRLLADRPQARFASCREVVRELTREE